MDFWELTARLNTQLMLTLYFVSPAGNFDKLFSCTHLYFYCYSAMEIRNTTLCWAISKTSKNAEF